MIINAVEVSSIRLCNVDQINFSLTSSWISNVSDRAGFIQKTYDFIVCEKIFEGGN